MFRGGVISKNTPKIALMCNLMLKLLQILHEKPRTKSCVRFMYTLFTKNLVPNLVFDSCIFVTNIYSLMSLMSHDFILQIFVSKHKHFLHTHFSRFVFLHKLFCFSPTVSKQCHTLCAHTFFPCTIFMYSYTDTLFLRCSYVS